MTQKKGDKKGQLWTFDAIASLVIFILTVSAFVFFIGSNLQSSENVVKEMKHDARSISRRLLDTGYPQNWTDETVINVGITEENYSINMQKWNELATIENNATGRYKGLLGTRSNVRLEIIDTEENILEEIGEPISGEKFIIQNRRVVVYNNSISWLRVLVWR